MVSCKICKKEFDNSRKIKGHTPSKCEECREKIRIREASRLLVKKETKSENTCSRAKCSNELNGFIGVSGKATKTCEKCYTMERQSDLKRSQKIKDMKANVSSSIGKNEKLCSERDCSQVFEPFNNRRNEISKLCRKCYDFQCEYEDERKIRPERVEYCKTLSKEKKPYEKLRAKKRTENEEEFLSHNAEIMSTYRDKNPEKIKEINKKSREKISTIYTFYKYKSMGRNLSFDLSLEEFTDIFNESCHYCNEESRGVDRINSKIGYTLDNCVGCCKTCNMMKINLDPYTFSKSIHNILVYNSMKEGESYYFQSGRTTYPPYDEYKNKACKRNKDFSLTCEEFEKIINKDCYLCGKIPEENDYNGIDRRDNNNGYILYNCESCCKVCNYMKKDINLIDFLNHIQKIDNHFSVSYQDFPMNILEQYIHNKLTKEELNNLRKIRREKAQIILSEEYQDKLHENFKMSLKD